MLWQGALMNAAAVTACILAVLGPGLSLPAEDCSHCFYRQTPPRGPSSEALQQLCHGAPGGQAFAALRSPTCDTAVLSAFRVGHVGTVREGEEAVSEIPDLDVLTPALLQGDGGDAQPSNVPEESPLRLWDSSITTLVLSSVSPQCSSVGGALYVVTGRGRLGPDAQGGDEGCEASQLLWSAMCCDVPSGGDQGFSVGLVREAEGEEEQQVNVEQLEEMLGVTELFSEGCGGSSGQAAVDFTLGAERVLLQDASTKSVEDSEDQGTDQDSSGEGITEQAARVEDQVADVDATPKQSDGEEGSTSPQDPDEEQSDERRSEARAGTESGHSSDEGETAEQTAEIDPEEAETNSTIIYLISTSVYILTLPLRPVFSTLYSLPGQVAYILQEDLGVLTALPGDTCYMLYFVASGVVSRMRWAVEVVLDLVGGCGCGLYHCTSAMVGELLGSCYTGVTGVGTLAGDSVGIVGEVADNAWWVTRLLGGELWEQSKGYAGTVGSEMGGQVMTVGGGLGTLVWRILRGVFRVIRFVVGLVFGTLRLIAVGLVDPATPDDPPALVNQLVNAE
ncbi:uncharacterized protein LOC130391271 [Gadus chalcogrammus]|uniref:uncharacterized protein LOC130391271 n=1 Tax=Gadus chalcogrammus TaxID=1042646 RepID=UPI0024C4C337|nr:uncharacterized protein LOC130391271 [Gadus chalcogrammus]